MSSIFGMKEFLVNHSKELLFIVPACVVLIASIFSKRVISITYEGRDRKCSVRVSNGREPPNNDNKTDP
jgi:capsular polysaccharide biosynthesis protein